MSQRGQRSLLTFDPSKWAVSGKVLRIVRNRGLIPELPLYSQIRRLISNVQGF